MTAILAHRGDGQTGAEEGRIWFSDCRKAATRGFRATIKFARLLVEKNKNKPKHCHEELAVWQREQLLKNRESLGIAEIR